MLSLFFRIVVSKMAANPLFYVDGFPYIDHFSFTVVKVVHTWAGW